MGAGSNGRLYIHVTYSSSTYSYMINKLDECKKVADYIPLLNPLCKFSKLRKPNVRITILFIFLLHCLTRKVYCISDLYNWLLSYMYWRSSFSCLMWHMSYVTGELHVYVHETAPSIPFGNFFDFWVHIPGVIHIVRPHLDYWTCVLQFMMCLVATNCVLVEVWLLFSLFSWTTWNRFVKQRMLLHIYTCS